MRFVDIVLNQKVRKKLSFLEEYGFFYDESDGTYCLRLQQYSTSFCLVVKYSTYAKKIIVYKHQKHFEDETIYTLNIDLFPNNLEDEKNFQAQETFLLFDEHKEKSKLIDKNRLIEILLNSIDVELGDDLSLS